MLLAALGQRRPTRDVDLLALNLSNDIEAVTGIIRQVILVEVDDGVAYGLDRMTASTIRVQGMYSGVRVAVPATVASAQVMLKVDVNVGDPVTPAPVELAYPALLDEPFPIVAYPIQTVLAEKLVTMIERGATTTEIGTSPGRGGTGRDGQSEKPQFNGTLWDPPGRAGTCRDATRRTPAAVSGNRPRRAGVPSAPILTGSSPQRLQSHPPSEDRRDCSWVSGAIRTEPASSPSPVALRNLALNASITTSGPSLSDGGHAAVTRRSHPRRMLQRKTATPSSPQTKESVMSTTGWIILIVVLLVLGGGGFGMRRR